MKRGEFIKLIESIGFETNVIYNERYYDYKQYQMFVFDDKYQFYNGVWRFYNFNDLTHIYDIFKKEMRAIKLKKILE